MFSKPMARFVCRPHWPNPPHSAKGPLWNFSSEARIYQVQCKCYHPAALFARPPQLLFGLGVCHRRNVTGAAQQKDLLKGVVPDYLEDVTRVLDQAERAAAGWSTVTTVFYPPPVVAEAQRILRNFADISVIAWGGYSQAERCRLIVGREELLAGVESAPSSTAAVCAVSVKGNFMFDVATHRDFLGACLGTGIERNQVGDIILQGEAGAQVLLTPNMVEHLEATLTKVRSVPVEVREIALEELKVRAAKVEEVKSVEASLRLDAVASAGFRMSRSKMGDMIKGGDVRVNWREMSKPSVEVKAGDLISCTGKGRVEVVEVMETKKGKFAVSMIRYV